MMTEKTTKGNKERTLTLKSGTTSPTSPKGSRSPSRVSTVVVESRRGKLSQTRKPQAPKVNVRGAPIPPNVFKPKGLEEDSASIRNLTEGERDAREKALENAKIRSASDGLHSATQSRACETVC